MAQKGNDGATKAPSRDDPIEHMAEELRELEGLNKPRWPKILLGIVALAVIGGLYYYYGVYRKPSERSWIATTTSGVQIELREPRAGKLTGAPSRLAWESISGRHDYLVKLYLRGERDPLFERATRNSTLDLKPEETGLITPGKAYVWTVQARDTTRRELASGQSWFEVR